MPVRMHVHGAAGSVTGSCYRLDTPGGEILIDCGLFQGSKTLKELNYRPFPFRPGGITAVLLTHAHVDHSGLLPKLMRAGFRGPIYATAQTRELSAVMLPDAGGIQEHEVAQLNRRLERRGARVVEPIYTIADAEACMRLFKEVAYGEWLQVVDGVRARWWDAGHILGSASIEVEINRPQEPEPLRLLFSGDLGPGGSDFSPDPQAPTDVDHLILESTYGDRLHEVKSATARRALLADEARAAHAAGGPLLIPAFAVERTQQLVTDLVELMTAGEVPPCRIFLDSPLAIRATKVFYRYGRDSHGDNPFAAMRSSDLLHPTETADESRALERVRGWSIIVAASGMCDAGRVRHHLKRLLWRREATVLLSGYQATGTLGRLLLQGVSRVSIQGDPVKVAARIRSLDVYSGHADGAALTAWAAGRRPIRGRIFLTHGEPDARRALAGRLQASGFAESVLIEPAIDDAYILEKGEARLEIRSQRGRRIAPEAASRLDWHNARARLMLEINDALEASPDDAARADLMDEMLENLAQREQRFGRAATT